MGFSLNASANQTRDQRRLNVLPEFRRQCSTGEMPLRVVRSSSDRKPQACPALLTPAPPPTPGTFPPCLPSAWNSSVSERSGWRPSVCSLRSFLLLFLSLYSSLSLCLHRSISPSVFPLFPPRPPSASRRVSPNLHIV